jgi:hypothetical protein
VASRGTLGVGDVVIGAIGVEERSVFSVCKVAFRSVGVEESVETVDDIGCVAVEVSVTVGLWTGDVMMAGPVTTRVEQLDEQLGSMIDVGGSVDVEGDSLFSVSLSSILELSHSLLDVHDSCLAAAMGRELEGCGVTEVGHCEVLISEVLGAEVHDGNVG